MHCSYTVLLFSNYFNGFLDFQCFLFVSYFPLLFLAILSFVRGVCRKIRSCSVQIS